MTTTTETGETYLRAQYSSPCVNVRYRISTDVPSDRMEEISILGKDEDEDKGAKGRGISGDDRTTDNDNNDDDNDCNDGLRYVMFALPYPIVTLLIKFLATSYPHHHLLLHNVFSQYHGRITSRKEKFCSNVSPFFTSCVTSKENIDFFSKIFHSHPRRCGPHGNQCTT